MIRQPPRSTLFPYPTLFLSVPATRDTVYNTASVGKCMTATAIMMLIEAGKVCLRDPVSRYIPNTPPTWRDITVRHLLTHTSRSEEHTSELQSRNISYAVFCL